LRVEPGVGQTRKLVIVLEDQPPFELPSDDPAPFPRKLGRPAAFMAPAVYGVDQRPVGELPILIELVQRIAGQDSLDRLPEDFPHVQIDAAYGPVVIDVVVEVEAGVEEEQQSLGAVLMK